MKTFATMIAAALALVLEGTFAGAQADSTSTGGHCTAMTVTDYISSYASTLANSSAWTNVTDGRITFTTSATGCVMITFSGPAFVGSGNAGDYQVLHVRTLLDGNNLCVPAPYVDVFLEAVPSPPELAVSITRICKNVAAGAHNVLVQLSGSGVLASNVLTVTHN